MKHASEAGFGISRKAKLHTENEMLRMRNEALHGQVDALQTALEQAEAVRQQQVAELQSKLAFFEEQMRLARERMFGKSSEQHVLEQINLFNEAESEANPSLPEPTVEQVVEKRKKPAVSRESMREDLPTKVVEHRLAEEECICECCGGALHEMGYESRSEINYIPARVEVVRHDTYKYGCRNCDQNGTSGNIIKAPAPAAVLPKSMASASLIAGIAEKKFMQGEPLYRQEKQFERLGINLSRQTMSNWMIAVSDKWLAPLYDRMRHRMLEASILHADETVLQVLKEPDRPADSQSYMWMYRTGRDGPHIVLYDYQTTRASKHAKNFLSGFSGYLQTDGYAGYNDLPGIRQVGCWAHARRKLHEAYKLLPEGERVGSASEQGIRFCSRLYQVETALRDVSPEERKKGRLEKSKPILDEMLIWLKFQKPRMLPKSAFGKAVTYCLNQWDSLNLFLEDGRLEVDNNRAERSIKVYVIGRKNWLFSNTPRGARSTAVLYSIMETATTNGLNAPKYLEWLLNTLAAADTVDEGFLDQLTPWSGAIPAFCRMENKSVETNEHQCSTENGAPVSCGGSQPS